MSHYGSNVTGTRIWLSHNSNLSTSYSWTNSALTVPTLEVQNYTGTVDTMYPTLTLHHYGYGGPRLGSKQGVLYIYGGDTDAKGLGSKNSYFKEMRIYPNTAGALYVNDNQVITSGNISSQSVNYATSAGSAGSATYCLRFSREKSTYDASEITTGMISNYGSSAYWVNAPGGMSYGSILSLCSAIYNTASLGMQLAWDTNHNNSTGTRYLWFRTGNNLGWSTNWKRIATTDDIPSTISWSNVTGKPSSYTPASHSHDYLPLSGGTLTGLLYINTNGNNAYIGSANSSWFHFQNGANISFYFSNSVYSNGNFYLYSDRSKKKNIKDIPVSSLESLFSVSDKIIKQFTWKSSGKASCGFIAQQLEKYVPEAVSVGPDGSKTITYDTAYAKLIASLIYKIKAQEKQISLLLEHANFSQEL